MTVNERVVAFLAERPTYQFSRAGIASGTDIDRGALMVPLRRLVAEGAIRRCNPGGGPAMYQSLDKPPTLTDAEVATSRALAAWLGSPAPKDDEPGNALRMLGTGLILDGLATRDRASTGDGAALLDRARKAGVL